MEHNLKISHLKHIKFHLGSQKLSVAKEERRIHQKKKKLAIACGQKEACYLVSILVGRAEEENGMVEILPLVCSIQQIIGQK
jgi:hypothetical protein